MVVLAAIRPDSWNIPLFLHILGAMVAVGAFMLALVYFLGALRDGSVRSFRAGYKVLLLGAVPGYLVMRVAAQWVFAKEGLDDVPTDPTWVGIGFIAGDAGLLLLLAATITAGVSTRRALAAGEESVVSRTAIRVSASLVGLMLVAYLVAVWAMTTKPA